MADQKPPWFQGDERETLHALLQFHRESIVRKVDGLDDATAASSPVASGTSLLWLVQHLSWAEQLWIVERFAGGTIDPVAYPEDETSLADAVAAYQRTWDTVDAIIAGAPTLDAPAVAVPAGSPVNLRWILAHLLEETARHAGHADILRELIDGQTGR